MRTSFRFREFALDMSRYELRRGENVVKAEPRVLEVLHYLIQQRERVVPKQELLDSIWRDTYVSDSALTSTIRDARRALSDSPTDPRWIKTVYGRGFRFVGDVADDAVVAPTPAAPPVRSSVPSIAVMPFTDLSPASDQAYFCDGIAEELINTLTRLEELRVVSRNVAFDFRNDEDVRALGAKLGVDHVLRGSVRKAGEQLRISVHLIDVRTGHHTWSEKYDRSVGDVFALQEEIAENTARMLLGMLSERNRKAMKSTPVRIDAYEFYLKGRTYQAQRTRAALESAIGMFEVAIEFDKRYAPAYAGLADALADLHTETHDATLVARAEAASIRAVELAPDLAETHVCRGAALAAAGRDDEASIEYELALAINPRSVDAHLRYAQVLIAEGNEEEARRMLDEVREDPRAREIWSAVAEPPLS